MKGNVFDKNACYTVLVKTSSNYHKYFIMHVTWGGGGENSYIRALPD